MKTFFFPKDWHPSNPAAEETIPKEYQKLLHPWIQQFLTSTQKNAHSLVEQRLNDVSEKFLLPIKNALLKQKFRVVCSATSSNHADGYLVIGDNAWSSFYWPPPSDFDADEKHIDSIGFGDIAALKNFVRTFDGIRDNPPGCSGDFEFARAMKSFQDTRLFKHIKLEGQESWTKALPFYTAPNGDTALVSPSDKIGWFCVETHRVKIREGRFADFVESYFKGDFTDSWSDPYVD